MRSAPPLIVAALLALAALPSCSPSRTAVLPPRDTILSESYAIDKGMGVVDTTFSAYVASCTSGTGAWNSTVAVWKRERSTCSTVLGELGYGTGPFTWRYGAREYAALSKFQTDLGLPVTGTLDSSTAKRLYEAMHSLEVQDIIVPRLYVSRIGQWFYATGTWKAVTNKLFYPVNMVDVTANVVTGECRVSVVYLISKSLDHLGDMRMIDLRVVHWDKDMVVAKSGDESDITLTVNVPAKDATWTQERPGILTAWDDWPASDGHPLPNAVLEGVAQPDSLHPYRMALKLVDGSNLSPPFDGGDLKEVRDEYYSTKLKYEALRKKNTEDR